MDIHIIARFNVACDQRMGQAYFNAAYELDSAFANSARGTGWDPFYDDSKLAQFLVRWHSKHND